MSRGWPALIALLVAGCSRGPYDLKGDPDFYQPVTTSARVERPGTIKVEVKEDKRPSWQKSHHNLWNQYVKEGSWAKPIRELLPELVADELKRAAFFKHTVVEGTDYDYALFVTLEDYYGKWPGGVWNYLVPFKGLSVEARVKIRVTLLNRHKNTHTSETFEATSERSLGNYRDGYLAAARELGKATRTVMEELLKWMYKQ